MWSWQIGMWHAVSGMIERFPFQKKERKSVLFPDKSVLQTPHKIQAR